MTAIDRDKAVAIAQQIDGLSEAAVGLHVALHEATRTIKMLLVAVSERDAEIARLMAKPSDAGPVDPDASRIP